jgi:hypothetical protein
VISKLLFISILLSISKRRIGARRSVFSHTKAPRSQRFLNRQAAKVAMLFMKFHVFYGST